MTNRKSHLRFVTYINFQLPCRRLLRAPCFKRPCRTRISIVCPSVPKFFEQRHIDRVIPKPRLAIARRVSAKSGTQVGAQIKACDGRDQPVHGAALRLPGRERRADAPGCLPVKRKAGNLTPAEVRAPSGSFLVPSGGAQNPVARCDTGPDGRGEAVPRACLLANNRSRTPQPKLLKAGFQPVRPFSHTARTNSSGYSSPTTVQCSWSSGGSLSQAATTRLNRFASSICSGSCFRWNQAVGWTCAILAQTASRSSALA